jgi:hypothetical protein
VTDLSGVLDHLLTEPRPRCEHPRDRRANSPVGRSLAVLDRACELVMEVNHAEVLAGWQERQARLRGWEGELSGGGIGRRRPRSAVGRR